MTATIKDEHGRVLATGHAFEKKDPTFIMILGRNMQQLSLSVAAAFYNAPR